MPDPKCTTCNGTGTIQLFTSSSRCDCSKDSVDNSSETFASCCPEIEDAQAEIASMLELEDFNRLDLSEKSLEELEKLAELIESHGDVFAKLIYHFGDIELARTAIEDEYAGVHVSLEDFAYELLEDTGQLADIPENLRPYFDFEKLGRDMEIGGDIFTIDDDDGMIHIFWSR